MDQGENEKIIENGGDEIKRKAEEAFREFQLKQKEGKQNENKQVVPDPINSEIEKSLKEFEIKQENQKNSKDNEKKPAEDSFFVRLVIKLSGGAIKNKEQANYVLLVVAILVFIISGYLFYIGIKGMK